MSGHPPSKLPELKSMSVVVKVDEAEALTEFMIHLANILSSGLPARLTVEIEDDEVMTEP